MEKLRENFFDVSPEELHSIDEIMVAFKGRSFLKQYLPNKPSKCGLKLWGRSEISGYIYDFGIYQGKVKDTWGLKYTWCGGVCCNMSSALLSDHNLKVFAENYFTTIPLLDDLKQHQIWYAGTTRINCPSN